jgi:hypothetical protein
MDINAQWLAWGKEDSVKIKVTRVEAEKQRVDHERRLEARIDQLEREAKDRVPSNSNNSNSKDALAKKIAAIKVAHAAAAAELGQGKPGGGNGLRPDMKDHGPCLKPGCTGRVVAHASLKIAALCGDCWRTFHVSEDTECKLAPADGRTAYKAGTDKRPRNVDICALQILARKRNFEPSVLLQDHVIDFITDTKEVSYMPAVMKVKVGKLGPQEIGSLEAFVLLDTCAAIGACDQPPYFHGNQTSCNYGVAGANARETPMSIGMSQSGATLLCDTQGQLFIAMHGGSLRGEQGDLNECTWSASQMLFAHSQTGGEKGAFLGEKSLQVHFPKNHIVEVAIQNGLFGVNGRYIKEDDPLFKTLDVIWATVDEVYYPPARLEKEHRMVLERPNFKVFALDLVEHGDVDLFTREVRKDLKSDNTDLTLRPHSYVGPLSLKDADEKAILTARCGGLSPLIQERMLGLNTSGTDVLTATGRKNLHETVGEPYQHPGSNMPRHKRRSRKPKTGELVTFEAKFGDEIATDSYPTGLDKTPTFQVVCCPVLGTMGWVYENHFKSDLVHQLKQFFSDFVLPFIVRGDFAKELHFGANEIQCRWLPWRVLYSTHGVLRSTRFLGTVDGTI